MAMLDTPVLDHVCENWPNSCRQADEVGLNVNTA